MKKTTLVMVIITVLVSIFVVPVSAMEKLPNNATAQQRYERIVDFRKRLEKVPENEIDGLEETIRAYLCDNYSYPGELICEAKAQRGNPAAQIEMATRFGLYSTATSEKPRPHSGIFDLENEMTNRRDEDALQHKYFTRSVTYLEMALKNPKSTVMDKANASYYLGGYSKIAAGFWGDNYYAKIIDNLSVPERIKLMEKAKQYYIQGQEFAKQAKDRYRYRLCEYSAKEIERLKGWLIKNKSDQGIVNKFLQ